MFGCETGRLQHETEHSEQELTERERTEQSLRGKDGVSQVNIWGKST